MAKIVLGKTPETFKKVVKVPMLDGSTGNIGCTFKYRNKQQFAEFLDALAPGEGLKPELDDEGNVKPLSAARVVDVNAAHDVEYVLGILTAWDLDEELSGDSVKQLALELPAAITAIKQTYRDACIEGRLGNS